MRREGGGGRREGGGGGGKGGGRREVGEEGPQYQNAWMCVSRSCKWTHFEGHL